MTTTQEQILHYHIDIKSWENVEVTVEEKEVLSENELYIVFNDRRFTKIQKHKAKNGRTNFDHILGQVSVSDWTKGLCSNLGHMFILDFYTARKSEKIIENKINREFSKLLAKQFSVYCPRADFRISL